MKKLIAILTSLLLIVVGCFLINKLLNPNIEYKLFKESEVDDEDIYNYGDSFKTLSLGDRNDFTYEKNGVKITYKDSILKINDYEVSNVESVYNYFSIYHDELIVISYTVDSKAQLLFYNKSVDNAYLISEYKGFILDINSSITFDDDGITVSFIGVKDNKLIKGNKDICKIKDEDMVVVKTYLLEYKNNERWIGEPKLLYSYNLFSYKNKNNLCKKESN